MSLFQCNEILRHGIVDQELIVDDKNIGQSLYEWQRKSDYQTVKGKVDAGLKVGFPIKGVPVTGDADFSEDKFNEWKSKVDSGMGRAYSETEAIRILRSTISESITEAWTECIRKSSEPNVGLIASLQELDSPEYLAFAVRYIPSRQTDTPPFVAPNGFQVAGAIAVAPLNDGDEIPYGGVGTLLKRNPNDAVSVQLNTTAGAITESVPGRPVPPVPPSKDSLKCEVVNSGNTHTAFVSGQADILRLVSKVIHYWNSYFVIHIPRPFGVSHHQYIDAGEKIFETTDSLNGFGSSVTAMLTTVPQLKYRSVKTIVFFKDNTFKEFYHRL
jgi:hypothetical protein